jgi:hypothetical protein
VRQLVAALERFKLKEAVRTELAVETVGGMGTWSAMSVAPRRSEVEASEPLPKSVET